ncbi:MarR family transcriptional regulator [Weissella coleopterorum]|uniref:MarR family transcriptional regulator n=1 Tax=Weissella coleopterorum TaxID=2714949 RepID=A0A6G8B0L9_9LACO|nr:MarR family transcriptional regulator [Weissella coleopterorum]QIL50854.1 MarR family transcriptional regulator [Weissella coleopterorum]
MEQNDILENLTELMRQPSLWFTMMARGDEHRQRPNNQRRLLRILSTSDQAITAGTIADILDIRPASVTQIIKKLEDEDRVERIKDQQDARIVLIKITQKGCDFLNQLDLTRDKIEDEIFNIFTDAEQAQFGAQLEQLNHHLNSEQFDQRFMEHLSEQQRTRFNEIKDRNHHFGHHFHRGPDPRRTFNDHPRF